MEAPAECFKTLNLARARPEQGQSINLSEEAVHAIAVEKCLAGYNNTPRTTPRSSEAQLRNCLNLLS